MRRPLGTSSLLTLAVGFLFASCAQEPVGRTIVLISLDSVRADALDFEDPEAFPHLAELARRGVIFDQAIASSSWTLPAHATMFTGAPPPLHGVEFDDLAIDPGFATLPEVLHKDGWFTAGWWTGWYLAGEYGFERGFDTYTNAMTGGRDIEARYRDALAKGNIEDARLVLAGRDVVGHRDITTPNVTLGLEATVETVDRERDLFLFAHLFDPHYDYIPPAPYDTRFDPDYTGDMDGRDFYENRRIFQAEKRPGRMIGARDLEHIEALYKGEIAFTDEHIGRMLAALEAKGRLANALIIVTADHGEEFFEHGNRGHRAGLYDEVLRVPLMMRDPRAKETQVPRHVGAQVGLIDVLPTVLGFAGLTAPTTSTGLDLGPAIGGAELISRPMISSLMQHNPAFGYLFLDSYRTPEHKLIRTLGLGADGQLELRRAELFDLAQDPQEQRGITDKRVARSSPIWAAFEGELADLRQLWRDSDPAPREARGTRIREVFEADLGGLGYNEGAVPTVDWAPPSSGSPGLSLPWPPGPRPEVRD